jgi:hypothetical protein
MPRRTVQLAEGDRVLARGDGRRRSIEVEAFIGNETPAKFLFEEGPATLTAIGPLLALNKGV